MFFFLDRINRIYRMGEVPFLILFIQFILSESFFLQDGAQESPLWSVFPNMVHFSQSRSTVFPVNIPLAGIRRRW